MFSDLPVCCSFEACSHLEMMSQICRSCAEDKSVFRNQTPPMVKKSSSHELKMHLDASLQTVFQLSPSRVIGVQAETRDPSFPHAGVLVETTLELVHCGRSIKAHHLCNAFKCRREHDSCLKLRKYPAICNSKHLNFINIMLFDRKFLINFTINHKARM